VAVANGRTHPIASREAGITEQTYYRRRKEYGSLQVDQARRLKELEQENGCCESFNANLRGRPPFSVPHLSSLSLLRQLS